MRREAFKRAPSHPKVRYYSANIQVRGRRYFEHFREIETGPEIEGADPDTQASWLGYMATYWASIRDFGNARRCLDLAYRVKPGDDWVLSCESDVLAGEGRWNDALKAAETAWQLNPRVPYTARSLGSTLLNLGRVEEAAKRLTQAAQEGESYELATTACWYLCALAETCMGEERASALAEAQKLAERAPVLAPLADRETHAAIARVRLDLAELADDHAAIEHWARIVRSPFHRKVVENFGKNPSGLRIRLPFRHAIQKHNECLPTSIGSAMAAMGTPVDANAMAAQLTFGGTPAWAAAEWLEGKGYVVRFFVATPEVTATLIKNGIAFILTLEADTSAHAVAIVGLDEAAGTVMVHDPNSFRATEYLLESLSKDEAPLGPRAMIAVLPERAQLLDKLLPQVETQTTTAWEARCRADFMHGSAGARTVVSNLAKRYPLHPTTRLLQALQERQDGRIGIALKQFQELLAEFPGSAFVRSNLLACCRSLRNTALMRKTLADVVERGILPGIDAQQQWRYPPPDYVAEYADLLRLSGATSSKAKALFLGVVGSASYCASAWHNLADLLWTERDIAGALLGYRIASCLADRNDHYARAYSDALGLLGRQEEGFAWLQQRVDKFSNALEGVATWITLIAALEKAGHPERALTAAREAAGAHHDSAELLAFLVPFQARMGNWADAEELLKHLRQAENNQLFERASSHFYGIRGELDAALDHAEKWLSDSPLSMTAREELVKLVAKRDGNQAAIVRAREWLAERPAHEDIEEIYCRQLERDSYTSWRKYSVLLRRVKRNREDGWAWRDLVFCAMYDFQMAGTKRQHRRESRIVHYLAECDRTSPDDAATIRAHAVWRESHGEWLQAVSHWLQAIESDPTSMYAYRRLWECAAREMIMLVAQRLGVNAAEEAVTRWMTVRHEDPEIVEACVDLLLDHGHGRTDGERALQLLLPELGRFPFHLGLRLSHANALQSLGRFQEGEDVFHEIVRRHPHHSWSHVRLAWMKQRRGEMEAALQELGQVAVRDPRNAAVYQAQVEILIEEQRFAEARAMIASTSAKLPAAVGWRESAIKFLIQCGDLEQAVATARAGVVEHPRGAYLWLLLGRTLSEHTQFAARGEIESCLRRSLSLNQELYEAADYLAMLLVEQRRYSEAEQVLREVEIRLCDPSPALGRLAWIRRSKGERRDAVEDMMSLLSKFPWYGWGWGVLLDWFNQDKSWDNASRFLADIVPEQRTNTRFRQQRLEVLAQAGTKPEVLDTEWDSLLHDFPEEMPLHLIRYDALCEGKRWPQATEVLQHIRTIHGDSPYVLARWLEVLVREQKKDEAIANLLQLFFAEAEPSVWPADHAWQALKDSNYGNQAYSAALTELQKGRQPTPRALSILATYALECSVLKRERQALLRTWFPHRGAREVLKMLKMVDALPERHSANRATLFARLSDFGYERLVVRYWSKNRAEVEAGVESWSETMRALTGLKKYWAARAVFTGWEERPGVGMWVVANYVMGLSEMGARTLTEIRSTCRAALAGLVHDHCARYLAHREAEACALLGNQSGFSECWTRYRAYFDGKLEKGEWFEPKRQYLLTEIPAAAVCLENNDPKYNAKVRSLRWKRFKTNLFASPKTINGRVSSRSIWWIIWGLFMLAQIVRGCK